MTVAVISILSLVANFIGVRFHLFTGGYGSDFEKGYGNHRESSGSMSDAQYAPLTAALVRTLTDKLYEKRKTGALTIET